LSDTAQKYTARPRGCQEKKHKTNQEKLWFVLCFDFFLFWGDFLILRKPFFRGQWP
jgi:hypothetical protein